MTQHKLRPGTDWVRRGAGNTGRGGGDAKGGGRGEARRVKGGTAVGGDWTCRGCGAGVFASKTECLRCGLAKGSDGNSNSRSGPGDGGHIGAMGNAAMCDSEVGIAEIRDRYPQYSGPTHLAIAGSDLEAINYDLVVQLLV